MSFLSHQGYATGICPDRHRRDILGRRQTLGHNLFSFISAWWPLCEQAGASPNQRGAGLMLFT